MSYIQHEVDEFTAQAQAHSNFNLRNMQARV